jgi:hypothetical protein
MPTHTCILTQTQTQTHRHRHNLGFPVNNNFLILLSPVLILILKRIGVLLHILLLVPTHAPP